jgi:hypothetical protein
MIENYSKMFENYSKMFENYSKIFENYSNMHKMFEMLCSSARFCLKIIGTCAHDMYETDGRQLRIRRPGFKSRQGIRFRGNISTLLCTTDTYLMHCLCAYSTNKGIGHKNEHVFEIVPTIIRT